MNSNTRESPCSPHGLGLSSPEEEDYIPVHDASTCLLETATDDASSDHELPEVTEGSFGRAAAVGDSSDTKGCAQRTSIIRVIALLCACSLSIGSH